MIKLQTGDRIHKDFSLRKSNGIPTALVQRGIYKRFLTLTMECQLQNSYGVYKDFFTKETIRIFQIQGIN